MFQHTPANTIAFVVHRRQKAAAQARVGAFSYRTNDLQQALQPPGSIVLALNGDEYILGGTIYPIIRFLKINALCEIKGLTKREYSPRWKRCDAIGLKGDFLHKTVSIAQGGGKLAQQAQYSLSQRLGEHPASAATGGNQRPAQQQLPVQALLHQGGDALLETGQQ